MHKAWGRMFVKHLSSVETNFGWRDKGKWLNTTNIHLWKQIQAKLEVHLPVLYTAYHVCKWAPQNNTVSQLSSKAPNKTTQWIQIKSCLNTRVHTLFTGRINQSRFYHWLFKTASKSIKLWSRYLQTQSGLLTLTESGFALFWFVLLGCVVGFFVIVVCVGFF